MAARLEHTNASKLIQRLLWNAPVAERGRPLPVVVLLGPTGAGKSYSLGSISRGCGPSVVHARPFDFQCLDDRQVGASTTTTALATLAGHLSRRWAGRPKATFFRFGLGWIAVNYEIRSSSPDRAKADLRQAINNLTQTSSDKAQAAALSLVNAAAAAHLLAAPAAAVLQEALPQLIRALGRRPLHQAEQWYADFPDAEGAAPLDALYNLSQARDQDATVTTWLMNAFLADVRSNFPPMARYDGKSSCDCEIQGRARHTHNWILLLDNIDHPAGAKFIEDLLEARAGQDRPDPLLIVATSGRWSSSWNRYWRPTWKGDSSVADQPGTIRKSLRASYEDWYGAQGPAPRTPIYPVLLEPLSVKEIAGLIDSTPFSPESELALRATAGLPGAVKQIKPLLAGRQIQPGQRDVLAAASSPDGGNPWVERLRELGLLQAFDANELVAAAPFATAPWLVSPAADSPSSESRIGIILTELRDALWVGAPAGLAATADQAELHPWLARTLNSALAWSDGQIPALYNLQFNKLLNDQVNGAEPVRRAYCHLALGNFSEAVDFLVDSFDKIAHGDWIGQLMLITGAPDNMALTVRSKRTYEHLVTRYAQEHPSDGSPSRLPIARLTAAQWLQANRFTVPDPELDKIVQDSLATLKQQSKLPFLGDLKI
jgi:hypothetical protein